MKPKYDSKNKKAKAPNKPKENEKDEKDLGRDFNSLDPEFNNRLADEGINPSYLD